MFDPFTVMTGALAAYLCRRGLRRTGQDLAGPVVVPPPAIERKSRPEPFPFPNFVAERGAHRTTLEAVRAFLAHRTVEPLLFLAGLDWPALWHLNKLTLFTGRPGTGKTTLAKATMGSMGALFKTLPELAAQGAYPGEGRMRWFVLDPSDAYLTHLYRTLPPDIPIVRGSPQDADGAEWDVAADVTDDAMAQELPTGIFPDAIVKQATDPFWFLKARAALEGLINVYHDRRSEWRFKDLVIPFKYTQFLAPTLGQSPRTRGMVSQDLVGKMGRSITAVASATMNQMTTAAGLWSRAARSFSLKRFLDRREVLHFSFPPHMTTALSPIANALSYVLIKLGLQRNDEFDHTFFWGDEARYLADLSGLDELGARGRGSGFGAAILVQGITGLIAKWGEARVKELIDITPTWVTLSAGPDTAEAFARFAGKVEGIQRSYGNSTTGGRSQTTGRTWTYSRGGGSYGWSESDTVSKTWGTSENFQYATRDAVTAGEVTCLPVNGAETGVFSGFVSNPNLGVFRFDTDFRRHFDGLPPALFNTMPLRPSAHQRLDPWTREDIARLKLEMTPEMDKALSDTWGI